MSSIWTPDGERPVGRGQGQQTPQQAPPSEPRRTPPGFEEPAAEPSAEDMNAQMDELRRQLAEAPASMVVANHCFGLFELAALHLSGRPPKLGDAQLAIDALSALVENLTGRLGEPEAQLREGLSQLRMAFVQIRQSAGNADGETS